MRIRTDADRGMIVVVDDLDEQTRSIHKYAVEADPRRRGGMWGKHEDTDLSGVELRHVQTVRIHSGHVVRTRWTPDPDASRTLVEEGASITHGYETDRRGTA